MLTCLTSVNVMYVNVCAWHNVVYVFMSSDYFDHWLHLCMAVFFNVDYFVGKLHHCGAYSVKACSSINQNQSFNFGKLQHTYWHVYSHNPKGYNMT